MGKIIVLCLAVLLRSIACVECASGDNATHERTILQKWENMESKVKSAAKMAVNALVPMLMGASTELNISSSCSRDVMKLLGGLKKLKPWAVEIVDASAKMIDGLLSGTVSSFGAYDQCLNSAAINERNKEVMFTGKYCTLEMKPPLPPRKDFYKLKETLPELKNFSSKGTLISDLADKAHFFYFISIRIGLCVPSGCSRNDIHQVTKRLYEYVDLTGNITSCEVKEEAKFTPLVIGVIFAFSFAGFMMLLGTTTDIYCHYRKKKANIIGLKILLAFSFISNFRRFVDTSTSSDTLSCLNGLRFLSMSWVILGHTYLIVDYQMLQSLDYITSYATDFAFQAIANASVAVDTFFLIGGLLVCYLSVKLVVLQKRPFNIKLYIFHRLWRIIPVYAFVIMYLSIADITNSGPLHHGMNKYVQDCRDNWWASLFFINNFYRPLNVCIPPSWYLSSDMQMYIASLIILLPLFRCPKVGLSITGVFICSSMAASGIVTYVNNYPPAMLFTHPDPNQRHEYWANFYFKPYVHAGPYYVGFLSGYFLAMYPKLKIPKVVQMIGWSLAFSLCFSVLYGVWEWNKGVDPTFLETMLYSSTNRVAWSLGVAWMVICCATGHGGAINYILSWKLWIPLGRLTFVAYLVHAIVQLTAVSNFRGLLFPIHYFTVWVYCGHLMVTYATAFAGSMLIEAPFLALEKIIIPREEKRNSRFQDSNSAVSGDRKAEKNGDIATIVHMNHSSESQTYDGTENNGFVCRL